MPKTSRRTAAALTRPTLVRPPRGWHYRELTSHGDENYQMVCGHYQKKGVYACNDCNLAPLNEWLALREALIEVTDLLEREMLLAVAGADTPQMQAIARARTVTEALD